MIKAVLSRFSSPSKTLAFLFMTLLCATLFSGVMSSAQPVSQETEFFYYADSARIPLSVSPDYVAVSFAPNTFTVESLNTSAFLQGFGVGASNDPDFNPQPGLIAGYDFQLLPIRAATTNAVAIADALGASGTTEWANPVFVNGSFTLIVTDELIAGFAKGTPLATIEAYNRANGVVISQKLTDSLVDTYLLRVTDAADANALTLANRYQTEGIASYAEPNFVTLTHTTASGSDAQEIDTAAPMALPTLENPLPPLLTANDPFYIIQWALNNAGVYPGAITGVDIDAQLAWDITPGLDTTIIAVIDGGVQLDHPDLDAKIISPFDPIGNAAGTDFDPTPNDSALTLAYDGQGTVVAGLVAAETNNNLGVAGTCRACKIMPIRIYYTSSLSNGSPVLTSTLQATAAGIQWAHEQGAAILTNSWTQTPSTTVTNAFRAATTLGRGGLGSFVTIAAGNTTEATYPALVGAPAYIASNVPGVLSVAASTFCDSNKNPTDCSGQTWGSNWGTENGIAAPGHRLASTDLTGTNGYVSQDYLEYSGTAVSAPIVAGVAGLLLSSEPTLTADQVRQRLMETANDIYSPGYDVATGWGRVNANNAVRNITTNSGLAGDQSSAPNAIASLPYTHTTSISGAFTNATDPTICTNVTNTIWYRYTPINAMRITANTVGSNNDTVLAVVTGTPGAWTSVVCNDAAATGVLTSAVEFDAVAGTPYYFIVGDWTTSVNVPFGAPASAQITLNVTGTGALTAEVNLQGRPTAPDPLLSVPLDVKLVTGATVVYEALVNTDTSGQFPIPNTLTVGTSYTLWVKNTHALASSVTFTFMGTSVTSIGVLREGDANNDNLVNVSDFSLLATAFSKTSSEVGYNVNADFNGDGIINVTDFSLLATNFSQTGAVRP